jgi:pimeloyl-ACP methyl ester carboxylesterase
MGNRFPAPAGHRQDRVQRPGNRSLHLRLQTMTRDPRRIQTKGHHVSKSIWVSMLGTETRYVGNRHRTRTAQAGDGPPLLLLHGIGGHLEAYSRNLVRLGEHFHTVAMDFVWHGLSSAPAFVGESIPTYADQVLDVMDTLGYESMSIEGESLGGWVALWLAINHPERVKNLVLNTSAGVLYAPGVLKEHDEEALAGLRDRSLKVVADPSEANVRHRLEWLMATPDRVTDELVDLRRALYSRPETRDALKQVFQHRFSAEGSRAFHFQEDELATVTQPTLVLWSDKNPGMGPEVGTRLAGLISGSEYHCITDAAHWPQWEQPDEHDEAVLSFLRKRG